MNGCSIQGRSLLRVAVIALIIWGCDARRFHHDLSFLKGGKAGPGDVTLRYIISFTRPQVPFQHWKRRGETGRKGEPEERKAIKKASSRPL